MRRAYGALFLAHRASAADAADAEIPRPSGDWAASPLPVEAHGAPICSIPYSGADETHWPLVALNDTQASMLKPDVSGGGFRCHLVAARGG